MFDPVTDEHLRLRRLGAPVAVPEGEPAHRTSLRCNVCSREIRPEEDVFWVDNETHCFQCHSMLDFELEKEREHDVDVRQTGTKWQRDDGGQEE
jgi:hypothetical protein